MAQAEKPEDPENMSEIGSTTQSIRGLGQGQVNSCIFLHLTVERWPEAFLKACLERGAKALVYPLTSVEYHRRMGQILRPFYWTLNGSDFVFV